MDKETILKIPMSSRWQSALRAWHYEKQGTYSILPAYSMLDKDMEK